MRFGLIRRGYSKSGGAEAYLLRLAGALQAVGHDVTLFCSPEWPMGERPHGQFIAVSGRTPTRFARELLNYDPSSLCDVVYSLERVQSCEYYRAGDGVHSAWLERRRILEPWWKGVWRNFDAKHRQMLSLENSMMRSRSLRGVIANSQMVAGELQRYHGLDASRVHVVYNGLPHTEFAYLPRMREDARARLNLDKSDIVVTFVGTGWERKGLRWAIEAVELCARKTGAPLKLIVAGRGNPTGLANRRTTFLGPIRPVKPLLMAADLFILPTIYDPFSNATLEAFATGLPVLTTKANGFSEIMQMPIDGQVVENGWNVQEMTLALERMLPLVGNEASRMDRVKRASRYTMDANLLETLKVLTDKDLKAVPGDRAASAPVTAGAL